MNVGMTITAFRPDVGENQADMALRAGDTLVKPAQREARLAMVELEDVA